METSKFSNDTWFIKDLCLSISKKPDIGPNMCRDMYTRGSKTICTDTFYRTFLA